MAPDGFVLTTNFPNRITLVLISSLGVSEFINHFGGGRSSERYFEGGEL